MSSKVRVVLVRSLIGSTQSQRATVASLGLRRMHSSVELEKSPEVEGALRKVQHLVKVESI